MARGLRQGAGLAGRGARREAGDGLQRSPAVARRRTPASSPGAHRRAAPTAARGACRSAARQMPAFASPRRAARPQAMRPSPRVRLPVEVRFATRAAARACTTARRRPAGKLGDSLGPGISHVLPEYRRGRHRGINAVACRGEPGSRLPETRGRRQERAAFDRDQAVSPIWLSSPLRLLAQCAGRADAGRHGLRLSPAPGSLLDISRDKSRST